MRFKDVILGEQNNIDDIEQKIIKFFKDNPYPEDCKVHHFAKQLGIEPHEMKTKIYAILSSLLKKEQ